MKKTMLCDYCVCEYPIDSLRIADGNITCQSCYHRFYFTTVKTWANLGLIEDENIGDLRVIDLPEKMYSVLIDMAKAMASYWPTRRDNILKTNWIEGCAATLHGIDQVPEFDNSILLLSRDEFMALWSQFTLCCVAFCHKKENRDEALDIYPLLRLFHDDFAETVRLKQNDMLDTVSVALGLSPIARELFIEKDRDNQVYLPYLGAGYQDVIRSGVTAACRGAKWESVVIPTRRIIDNRFFSVAHVIVDHEGTSTDVILAQTKSLLLQKEVVRFTIDSGKIAISDPCYFGPSIVEPAIMGEWTASVDRKGGVVRFLVAEAVNLPQKMKRIQLGTVPVDSGQMSIGDETAHRGDDRDFRFTKESWYDECISVSSSQAWGAVGGKTVVSQSGYGDGVYLVESHICEETERVAKVKVIFVDESQQHA